MITTLAWKEYREQSVIWVAVAVLTTVLLLVLLALMAPHGVQALDTASTQLLALVPLGLTMVYGLVCGAMLLAGEDEGRTQVFLDTLPVLRRRVWTSKLVAGLLLALLQGIVLGIVVMALGMEVAESPQDTAIGRFDWLWVLPAICVEACAWGLLGSAMARNALSAVILAVFLLIGVWVVTAPAAMAGWPGLVLCRALLAGGAAVCSLMLYARTDWERQADRGRTLAAGERLVLPGIASWRVLFWLTWQQGRLPLLILAGGAFLCGLMFAPLGPIYWPILTLLVGMACGCAVFLGEQTSGAARFLGDQRLPLRRIWAFKTALWLIAAGLIALLVLLAGALHLNGIASNNPTGQAEKRAWEELLQSVAQGLGGPGEAAILRLFPLLGIWLIIGFAVGQLCSLVWRKSVAVVFVALPASIVLSGLWLPSLLGGGLPLWQIYVVPVLVLVTSVLLLRAWASERVTSWRPLVGLGLGVAAVVGWIALCLWYRVAQVPDVGEPFDLAAFVASLPVPEKNQAGELIRQAMRRMGEHEHGLEEPQQPVRPGEMDAAVPGGDVPPPPGGPFIPGDLGPMPRADAEPEAAAAPAMGPAGGPAEPSPTRAEELDRLLKSGGKPSPELGRWLDLMFQGERSPVAAAELLGLATTGDAAGPWLVLPLLQQSAQAEWAELLRKGAREPLGVVLDPRNVTVFTPAPTVHQAHRAGELFVARALQLQARGEHEAALEHLVTALALSRQMRHDAVLISWLVGISIEAKALRGLDHWLEHVGPRPALLRRALRELTRHEAALPPDTDTLKAEYLTVQNSLEDPSWWSRFFFGSGESHPAEQVSSELEKLAWLTPWERQRAERLLHATYAGWLRGLKADYPTVAEANQKEGVQMMPSRALAGWLPPDAAASAGLTRHRLARLLWRSWLRDFVLTERTTSLARTNSLCRVRGERLALALALYRAEKGEPAATLEQLVPEYLAELPRDPFAEGPFHYRVSQGENLNETESGMDYDQQGRHLPAGTGVVWSTGPDRKDNGGTNQGRYSADQFSPSIREGWDWIFLVPAWRRE